MNFLLQILPFLVGLLASRGVEKSLPGIAGSSLLKRLPGGSRVASALGRGFLPGALGLGGFFAAEALARRLLQNPSESELDQRLPDISSNAANFNALVTQQNIPRLMTENDRSFLKLLEDRQVQGLLSSDLERIGFPTGGVS